MDVGAAVSGCGPAYAYLILDAMAGGGVACGLPRPDAVRFAAQTLLGAAQMVLETGKHPDQLKNDVCSPGGSTIQGVRTLEQRAVRAAVMDAVIAACEKKTQLWENKKKPHRVLRCGFFWFCGGFRPTGGRPIFARG